MPKLNSPSKIISGPYEQFYELLFDSDPSLGEEVRARQLVELLRQLDQVGRSTSRAEFSDLVSKAIVACGFADELEAWAAVINVIDPVLLLEDESPLGTLSSSTPRSIN